MSLVRINFSVSRPFFFVGGRFFSLFFSMFTLFFSVFNLFFSSEDDFQPVFFSMEPQVPFCLLYVYIPLFPSACAYTCARTCPREIHNVRLFPPAFRSIKKYSPATVLFPVIYKKIRKNLSKNSCIKVAGKEKVRTFATAFERESR